MDTDGHGRYLKNTNLTNFTNLTNLTNFNPCPSAAIRAKKNKL